MIQSFRDLEVWAKGMDLAERVYAVTETFPRSELYGLTSQRRRAAVNYPRHVKIAIGSVQNKGAVPKDRASVGLFAC